MKVEYQSANHTLPATALCVYNTQRNNNKQTNMNHTQTTTNTINHTQTVLAMFSTNIFSKLH